MPVEVKNWLEEFATANQLGFEFDASQQTAILSPVQPARVRGAPPPKPIDPELEKVRISVSTKKVSMNKVPKLKAADRDAMAENMVKLFIAKELGLKSGEPLPSKAEIRQAGIAIKKISGSDKEMTKLLEKHLKDYGVRPEAAILKEVVKEARALKNKETPEEPRSDTRPR